MNVLNEVRGTSLIGALLFIVGCVGFAIRSWGIFSVVDRKSEPQARGSPKVDVSKSARHFAATPTNKIALLYEISKTS
jgi:hypothetical protein